MEITLISGIAQGVFWSCLCLTLYTYFIYPVCIWTLARWFSWSDHHDQAAVAELPEVTLIVAAHNEEAVIDARSAIAWNSIIRPGVSTW